MSKEVTKKEKAEVAEFDQEYFDDLPSADASDYRIPNIVICQPTSRLTATAGEMVDLNTKQVVSGVGKPLNFVPVWFYKTWETYHVRGKEREYVGKELFTQANALWKWKEEASDDKGKYEVRRYININVFMLLEKDLDSAMPQLYMFRFRSTSANEGKKLLTHWTNAKNYRQLPFSFVFSITPTLIQNDDGKYFLASLSGVYDGDKQRRVTGEALKTVMGWVDMIKNNISSMTSAQMSSPDVETEESSSTPIPQKPEVDSSQLTF